MQISQQRLEDTGMPLGKRLLKSRLSRNSFNYILFSVSLLGLLLFSYLNIFSLPLATTGVSTAIDYSGEVSGIEVSLYGEIQQTTSKGFVLRDISSDISIDAVWVGDHALPINGTVVIASGNILSDASSPVLICEAIEPESQSVTVYQSPWTLPVIRIFAVSVVWFFVSVFLCGIFSLRYTLSHNIAVRNHMRALTDIALIAAIISIGLLMLLWISEREIVSQHGITLYAIVFSMVLLLISVIMRFMKKPHLSELANSIPVVAWISILVGIPLTLILAETIYVDFIAKVLTDQLKLFPLPFILGLMGFLFLGLYLGRRKYEIIAVRTIIAYVKREVNRHQHRY